MEQFSLLPATACRVDERHFFNCSDFSNPKVKFLSLGFHFCNESVTSHESDLVVTRSGSRLVRGRSR